MVLIVLFSMLRYTVSTFLLPFLEKIKNENSFPKSHELLKWLKFRNNSQKPSDFLTVWTFLCQSSSQKEEAAGEVVRKHLRIPNLRNCVPSKNYHENKKYREC